MAAFLKHFAECGNVTRAAKLARIGRQNVYVYRDNHPDFAERWKQAEAQAVEVMEAEAHRRAVTGTLKPVYQGGKKVGTIREYSDTLMIFLLKARRPDVYRDNARVVHAGDPTSPVGVKHEHRFSLTPDDVLAAEQLARLAGADVRPDGGPQPVPAP